MSFIAEELARRASPAYVKEQVRFEAERRSSEMKERYVSSPLALGITGGGLGILAGGLFGAITGALLAARRREGERFSVRRHIPGIGVTHESWEGAPIRDASGEIVGSHTAPVEGVESGMNMGEGSGRFSGVSDRMSDMASDASGRISDVKAQASERIDDFRAQATDRIHETREQLSETMGNVKQRASELIDTARERVPTAEDIKVSARENTGLFALGGLIIGAGLGLLIPVSDRERQLMRTGVDRLRSEVSTFLDAKVDLVKSAIEGQGNMEAEANVDTNVETQVGAAVPQAGTMEASTLDTTAEGMSSGGIDTREATTDSHAEEEEPFYGGSDSPTYHH